MGVMMRLKLVVRVLAVVFFAGVSNSFAQQIKDQRTLLNNRAEELVRTSPDSAFLLANAALRANQDHHAQLEEARSYHIIGSVLLHRGLYSQALGNLLLARNIFNEAQEDNFEAHSLSQLGVLYENIHQPEMAKESHLQALRIFEREKDSAGVAYTYMCMGQLYERIQKFDSALFYQRTALTGYRAIQDVPGQIISLTNMGTVYEHQQVFDTAMIYFRESLQKSGAVKDSLSIIRNLNNVGDVYRGLGNISTSLQYTYQALAIAVRHNEKDEISRAYKDLARSYFLLKDFKKAFAFEEQNRELYDELRALDAIRQAELYEKLFQIDEKEDQINRLTSDQKIDTVVRGALIIVVLLLSFAAWLGISRQKLKRRKEQEDAQRNIEMHEAKEKIIRIELENVALREQQLQQELKQKTRSLSSQALQMTGQSRVMEVVQHQLEEIMAEQSPAKRKRVRNLLKRIDSHTSVTEQDWESFRQTFENLDDTFFEKISRTFPDLTPGEIRLASLIRTNMPTKAMAETLGISQSSLRISRYRLKKKLRLGEEQNLQAYILGL